MTYCERFVSCCTEVRQVLSRHPTRIRSGVFRRNSIEARDAAPEGVVCRTGAGIPNGEDRVKGAVCIADLL